MGCYITFDGGSGTGKGMVITWFEEHLKKQQKRVVVVKDNRLDPLRDYGAMMLGWCEANGVDRQTFLLPLFVAGGKIVEEKLDELLRQHDFLLRDRSFITSLAYQPASGCFSAEQLWDLFVRHMGFRVPDLAVIVDADINVALERINKRKQQDIGLGGKMSGGLDKRQRIREMFLALPEKLDGQLHALVVQNHDIPVDKPHAVRRHSEKICQQILRSLSSRGISL